MGAGGSGVVGQGLAQPRPQRVAGPAVLREQLPQHPRHLWHGAVGQLFPRDLLEGQQEGRREQDEGDVMPPAEPAAGLVLVEAGLPLRLIGTPSRSPSVGLPPRPVLPGRRPQGRSPGRSWAPCRPGCAAGPTSSTGPAARRGSPSPTVSGCRSRVAVAARAAAIGCGGWAPAASRGRVGRRPRPDQGGTAVPASARKTGVGSGTSST